jgi:hypothetical protein
MKTQTFIIGKFTGLAPQHKVYLLNDKEQIPLFDTPQQASEYLNTLWGKKMTVAQYESTGVFFFPHKPKEVVRLKIWKWISYGLLI